MGIPDSENGPAALRGAKTLVEVQRLAVDGGSVIQILDTSDSDPERLIKALEASPVLAVRVIGVANSAASSASQRMESVERCVLHMGARHARTVALSLAMQLMMQGLDLEEDLHRRLWSASIHKACAAAQVAAQLFPGDDDARSKAYTQGLIQDLALPLLASIDAKFFREVLCKCDERTAWTQREREHFGTDHAQLAGSLLRQWGGPDALIASVENHHALLEHGGTAGRSADGVLEQLPAAVAGLVPHDREAPNLLQARQLAALQLQMSLKIDTGSEVFCQAVKRESSVVMESVEVATIDPMLIHRVMEAVTQDTFALVRQVTKLDHQLGQQTGHLAEIQQEAITDSLTGLLNRRGFERLGVSSLEKANTAGGPVTCVMVDLDDFKPINDTHGHDAGDRILRAAAELLKSAVRPSDIVGRIGGDEFAILMAGMNQGDARGLVERLHANCNGREIAVGSGKACLRMSIGAIHLPQLGASIKVPNLLEAADAVMYQCKKAGKATLKFKSIQRRAA